MGYALPCYIVLRVRGRSARWKALNTEIVSGKALQMLHKYSIMADEKSPSNKSREVFYTAGNRLRE